MLLKSRIEFTLAVKGRQTLWHWLLNDYIRQVINRSNLYIDVERERKLLAKLTDAELRDIGVHRADADAESRRSFLDVPADRLNLHSNVGSDLVAGEERRVM